MVHSQVNSFITVVYRKRVSSTFSTFFHIFTHFYTFFHPYHYISQTVAANYTIVKRKWGIPKTLLMDTLILNLKPFVSESSKKAVPQNIFQKLLQSQNIFPKLSLQKSLKKRQNNPALHYHHDLVIFTISCACFSEILRS